MQPLPAYHANHFHVARSLSGVVIILGVDQMIPQDNQIAGSVGWFGTLSLPAITAKALHKALGEAVAAYEAQWGPVPDALLKGPERENVIHLGAPPN